MEGVQGPTKRPQELKQRIRQEMQLISQTMLLETLNNFKERLMHCLAVNGGHFGLKSACVRIQHYSTNFFFIVI